MSPSTHNNCVLAGRINKNSLNCCMAAHYVEKKTDFEKSNPHLSLDHSLTPKLLAHFISNKLIYIQRTEFLFTFCPRGNFETVHHLLSFDIVLHIQMAVTIRCVPWCIFKSTKEFPEKK